MARKQMAWKTKGMNRDISVSAFNPEFSFQNRNLRFSTANHNTTMSWVNERGTKKMSFTIDASVLNNGNPRTDTAIWGTPIGTAIINKSLIIFTTDELNPPDYIYLLEYDESDSNRETLKGKILYNGYLGFDVKHPIETLPSYESDLIQKVYWTDGINQPRMINITSGNIQVKNDTQFDFVSTLQLKENVYVEKVISEEGMFPPGVIQYAFTYYKNHGQESNIFYTTPLQYISYIDRGASPEDTRVGNVFKITVENTDSNFDFLRIYSIQRTTKDGTPIVKRVQDLPLYGSATYSYYKDSSPFPASADALGQLIGYNSGFRATFNANTLTFTASDDDIWKCYSKKKYPNIMIEVEHGYITWGASSTDDSILCIQEQKEITTGNVLSSLYIVEINNNSSKTVENLNFISKNVTYTDTGTSGDNIDYTELLYKGGESIFVDTINQKDATLFLGNITISRPNIQEIPDIASWFTIKNNFTRQINFNLNSDAKYIYGNQLNSYSDVGRKHSVPCSGFKTGDYYRLGVQFQYKTGKWSDPIYLDDCKLSTSPQFCTSKDKTKKITEIITHYDKIILPVFKGKLNRGAETLKAAGYIKMRGVIVFPKIQDRMTICQGVVCPTLYTDEHRNNLKDIYTQSSWFFRGKYIGNNSSNELLSTNGTYVPSYGVLSDSERWLYYMDAGGDVKSNNVSVYVEGSNSSHIRNVEIQGSYNKENKYKIDTSTLTLHSPDLEFDSELSLISYKEWYYRQVGRCVFDATYSDIDIQTETPTIGNAGGFDHRSFVENSPRGIVAGLFYEDYLVDDGGMYHANATGGSSSTSPVRWMVFPWHKSGSINNDYNRPYDKDASVQMTASAVLKRKVISNLRISNNTIWRRKDPMDNYSPFSLNLFSSNENTIIKLENEGSIYRGNIDMIIMPDSMEGTYFAYDGRESGDDYLKVAGVSTAFCSTNMNKTYAGYNGNNYGIYACSSGTTWNKKQNEFGDENISTVLKKEPVRMKYKSTPHLVLKQSSALDWDSGIPIVEIGRNTKPETLFGGVTEDALRENEWIPCGEPVLIANDATFEYSYGDTYFQRWDCLKTYPYTNGDENQIVEIGSFMLETRVNIDGRYDRNRGQINNLNVSPINFNLLNPVYSQVDNFFNYRIQNSEYYKNNKFTNLVTWSLTKQSGADVDVWTKVTLANTLELDGDKGEVTSLRRLNDQLIAFQDTGISQILYNENTQIATNVGVPIELANSGKVQGNKYISDTVGCSNKWSITSTPAGLYFMDSVGKHIWHLGSQLTNLSVTLGMDTWTKDRIPNSQITWDPQNFNNFVSYYDLLNEDVLFINKGIALAYSEKFQTFTSFYDYGNAPYFCNFDSTGVWLYPEKYIFKELNEETGELEIKDTRVLCALYKHNAGDYCKFFDDTIKPYSITLVANPEPLLDKIFTNLEFRACVDSEGTVNNDKYNFYLPFDYLEAWNEYQHGISYLRDRDGHAAMLHHDNNKLPINGNGEAGSLKRKFRIWKCDIPRDNVQFPIIPNLPAVPTENELQEYNRAVEEKKDFVDSESRKGIYREKSHPNDRMRNPWLYLRLTKETETDKRTEIHDVVMTYFG